MNSAWGLWNQWSRCSTTCGEGTQGRKRYTADYLNSERDEPRTCSITPCPVTESWGRWEAWGACSKTCGEGEQTRKRCNFSRTECERSDPQMCVEIARCQENGQWVSWQPWGECSVTCGSGSRQRTRCKTINGRKECEIRVNVCRQQPCSITSTNNGNTSGTSNSNRGNSIGAWQWGHWSPCDTTCGTGSQNRARFCSTGKESDCTQDR